MTEKGIADLNEGGYPTREGVYQIRSEEGTPDDPWEEIEVYNYPPKGFCCFQYDLCPGGGIPIGAGNDDHACHVSVQFTGLTFGKRLRGVDELQSA